MKVMYPLNDMPAVKAYIRSGRYALQGISNMVHDPDYQGFNEDRMQHFEDAIEKAYGALAYFEQLSLSIELGAVFTGCERPSGYSL